MFQQKSPAQNQIEVNRTKLQYLGTYLLTIPYEEEEVEEHRELKMKTTE